MTEPATVEGVHQQNLSRVLRLVHLTGPLSRAALTDATGLNRSTVSALTSKLAEASIVLERAPDPSGRVGRPSPVVSAHPSVVAIAAVPEVDALTIAAVGLDQRVLVRVRLEQRDLLSPAATAELIGQTIAAWQGDELAEARIVGVGLAVPGLVRASDGLVRLAPHLEWTDTPLREMVAQRTGLHTAIGNDASMGAIAEHLFGAGRGAEHVVYLNGGASGIGGGLIVHGMPVAGAAGFAGEFGHNRPGIATGADRRTGNGALEEEVSRARLLQVTGLRSADDPALAAAVQGSATPAVAKEVDRQLRILATALANAVNVLNPAVVILGGFLAILAQHDLEGLREQVAAAAMPHTTEGLEIRVATLAEDRLLIGAAEASFGPLLRDPLG